jgi:hypothetical protein
MTSAPDTPAAACRHRIELNLQNVGQLFNTMDPSPFHEKDLDHDAEEFIENWALEFPAKEPVALIVHLEEFPEKESPQPLIEQAVHNYFAYRGRMKRLEFQRLLSDGWKSLLIGLVFLGTCLAISQLVIGPHPGALPNMLRESLTIGGWVAMWRPLEIYLYEWWPLRRRGKIYDKLGIMPVEARRRGG